MVKAFIFLENEAQQWCFFIGHTWKASSAGTLLGTRRSTTTRTCAAHTETFPVLPTILPHPSVTTCQLQIPYAVYLCATSVPNSIYSIEKKVDTVEFIRTESTLELTR